MSDESDEDSRYGCMFKHTLVPVLIIDLAEQVIDDANPAACDFYGYPRERLQGMRMDELDPAPTEEIERLAYRQRSVGRSDKRVLRHRLADGTVRSVEVYVGEIPEEEYRTCAIVFDVTEREEAFARLEEQKRDLEHAIGAQGLTLAERQARLQAVAHVVGLTLDMRDPYTSGHQVGVAALVARIIQRMDVPFGEARDLEIGAAMLDVGKIRIPADILTKGGPLSDVERRLVETHPDVGHRVLSEADLPERVCQGVLEHHERLDGSGYPRGLSGDQIGFAGRLYAVADVVEAMCSHRPYRPALGVEAALEEVRRGAGTLFDEDVVALCVAVFEDGFRFKKPSAASV
jgi:PAS domain S-box-containing protein